MNPNEAKNKKAGRALLPKFMDSLKREKGDYAYAPIVQSVREDKDLNMDFRGDQDYLNVYFKGHNVLQLYSGGKYEIAKDFRVEGMPPSLGSKNDVNKYLELLPMIKDRVSRHPHKRTETEYEQLIIRANNREDNGSCYVVIDRAYSAWTNDKRNQWDLVAIGWPRKELQKKSPIGHLVLIEVKYGLNPDIGKVADQIERYGGHLKDHFGDICTDMEKILHQKTELGLIERTEDQKKKLMKLKLNPMWDSCKMVVYLIDYNPNSTMEKDAIEGLQRLKKLESEGPVSRGQIRIAKRGFAMWDQGLKPLD